MVHRGPPYVSLTQGSPAAPARPYCTCAPTCHVMPVAMCSPARMPPCSASPHPTPCRAARLHCCAVPCRVQEVADADLLKPWQLTRERYKQQKRLLGDRQKDTMSRVNKFMQAFRRVGDYVLGGAVQLFRVESIRVSVSLHCSGRGVSSERSWLGTIITAWTTTYLPRAHTYVHAHQGLNVVRCAARHIAPPLLPNLWSCTCMRGTVACSMVQVQGQQRRWLCPWRPGPGPGAAAWRGRGGAAGSGRERLLWQSAAGH